MTQLEHGLANGKPIIAVIVIDDIEQAVPMAKALLAGGVQLLEITLRTPSALAAIEHIRQQLPQAIVGAGTVCTAEQFQQAVEAGAQFIVSPGLTEELIAADNKLKLLDHWHGIFIPGVATASEVMRAKSAGYTQLKCFPAEAISAMGLLKAWAGPFPEIQFCPTGGINPDNYQQYLALDNVMCVGASWLTEKVLIDESNWAAIESRAKALTG